jgi:neutral trehalase
LPEPIKEQIFDDVNSVCESTAKDMMRPCKEGSWEIAKEYFDDLDRTRGTNWRQTFPEFDGY